MKKTGFTLIELLVVVTLLGILSMLAYPNYVGYIRDTYKSTAKNDMVAIAYKLERVKSKQFTYRSAFNDSGILKDNIYKSYTPLNGEKRYNFTYEYEDNSYKIIATPTVNQDANSGKLLLSFNGNKYEKKWDKNNDNSYSEDWWLYVVKFLLLWI